MSKIPAGLSRVFCLSSCQACRRRARLAVYSISYMAIPRFPVRIFLLLYHEKQKGGKQRFPPFFPRRSAKSGAGQTVHTEHHAGDVAGHLAGQEHEGVGHLFRLADAAQRNLGAQGLDDLLGHRAHHVGIGDAGSHRVHPDAVLAQLPGQRKGEAVHCELAGGIGNAAGLAVAGDHGAGVQNYAAALGLHDGRHRTGTGEHALHVQVHHLFKGGLVVFVEGGGVGHTRIVHQNINAAVLLRHLPEGGLHAGQIGKIRRDARHLRVRVLLLQSGHRFLCRFLPGAGENHGSTLPQKGLHRGQTDAPGSSGNDGDLVFQKHHTYLLFVLARSLLHAGFSD